MTSQVPTEAPPRVVGKTYWDRGWQKCKEQPFVPLGVCSLRPQVSIVVALEIGTQLPPGVLATCVALIGASQQFRTGNRQAFNRFLRFRVVAQGITIVACVVGSAVWAKDSAAQKAIAREEELEKIRVAGSRPVAVAELATEPPASPSHPQDTPPPEAPATTEELWRRWGVKPGSKT